MKKINKLTDEECLELFLKLIEDRVGMETKFVQDPDTGNLTHQMLEVSCGDYITVSHPQPLGVILRPATGEEQGAVVN